MRKVQCEECGKRYDFDVDDFCPRCGAFNQPGRVSRLRVDGIDESNHSGSFVHRELHREDRARRRKGLEQPRQQPRVVRQGLGGASQEAYQKARQKEQRKGKVPVVVWVILAIFAVNILLNVGGALFRLLLFW